MTPLEEYYNKFNEDKRLLSRHGQVEYNTTMHFIMEYVKKVAHSKDVSVENAGEGGDPLTGSESGGNCICGGGEILDGDESGRSRTCGDGERLDDDESGRSRTCGGGERLADGESGRSRTCGDGELLDGDESGRSRTCGDGELLTDGESGRRVRLADIGAGTGRYSIALAKLGIEVSAIELVNYNLGILKKHAREELGEAAGLVAYHGDARRLKRFRDNSFDITLLLGPMYHLHTHEDRVQALNEAKRVTRSGGYIFVGYVMGDYALVKHGFIEQSILSAISSEAVDEDYVIKSNPSELYEYVRLGDIDALNKACGLEREIIFAPDGPADYIRHILNRMSEEEFEIFKDYQLKNALRSDLLGASSHTVDVLRV